MTDVLIYFAIACFLLYFIIKIYWLLLSLKNELKGDSRIAEEYQSKAFGYVTSALLIIAVLIALLLR